jgi:Cupin superfamily protein
MSDLLSIDRGAFADAYGHLPFRVEHRLTEHPLLELDSLAELADFLPTGDVEHNLGDVPEILPTGEAARLDARPGEIVLGIETNGCWMGLRHVEQHPEYNRLLDETLDEVMPHVVEVDGEMRHRTAFIFITSPGGTTPAHVDPEHNLLLQVRGWKELTIGRWPSKEDEQREVEGGVGGNCNIEAMPDGADTFRMDPGDGVYIPIHAPHLVKSGDTASISLSITWHTPRSERELMAYYLNARLRRLKLSPRPPGDRPLSDKAKAGFMRAVHKVRGTGVRGTG